MNKKSVAITCIIVLISVLILMFSYFDLKKYDNKKAQKTTSENIVDRETQIETEIETNETNEIINDQDITPTPEITKIPTNTPTPTQEPKDTPTPTTVPTITESTSKSTNKLIVIDPGHQRKGDNSKEPIGPGATETKAKVTTGATGVSTKQLESELNLKVSLLLQKELEKRGYTVIMTRTTQDINISNSERAKIANEANADAFIRIHADSSTSSTATGMSALCQTTKNKYNGNIAIESYSLSKCILDNMVKQTGARNRGVIKTDTMSGINWATVPTTIIEMGFLSNPDEDNLLASNVYQNKIVKGIADGIDEFIK